MKINTIVLKGEEIRTDCEEEKVNRSFIVSLFSLGPCPADIVLYKSIALDEPGFTFLRITLDRFIFVEDCW